MIPTMEQLFRGIFDTETTTVIALGDFLSCVITALGIGILIAIINTFRNRYTKSLTATLAVLPAIVCVVIMMVNGNIGTGVAVAGAFSLIRFRSAPGTAREIATIFLAMGAGLVVGMGYIAYAVLFTAILGGFILLWSAVGYHPKESRDKTLRITIPEDLDYSTLFDDVFNTYTASCVQTSVKTAAMGSLYKLKYNITLRDKADEKPFMDALRCRNGNLEISISARESETNEL